MTTRVAALLIAAAVAGLAAGCNSKKKSSNPPKGTIPVLKLHAQILKFSGPKTVSCKRKGQITSVGFKYETKNANSVEPEVDNRPVGAQAGYPPRKGTMHFPFKCPGPHKLTIVAQNLRGPQVTRSAVVQPSSGG